LRQHFRFVLLKQHPHCKFYDAFSTCLQMKLFFNVFNFRITTTSWKTRNSFRKIMFQIKELILFSLGYKGCKTLINVILLKCRFLLPQQLLLFNWSNSFLILSTFDY
jgi:hypothetical protein